MSGWQKGPLRPRNLLLLSLILGTVLFLVLTALSKLYIPPDIDHSFPEITASPTDALSVPPEAPDASCTAFQSNQQDSGRINLLLIGQDSRESDSQARSDAMILCSVYPDKQSVTLISFLRDLYVQIPGHSSNRLNAAYAFGGMALLKETLSQNFDIRLDGCIEVDFSQFIRLIDLMGGVSLDLRRDEAQLLNRIHGTNHLKEGLQQLDGSLALTYVRIRSLDPDSDFSRTLRQRKLLAATFQALRQCSVREALSLLAAMKELVSTDLAAPQLASCVSAALPLLSGADIIQLQIPADGTYTSETVDGMAVLIADPRQTEAIVHAALAEE